MSPASCPMKLAWSCILVLVLVSLSFGAEPPPVVVDYFYEAGCPDCNRVRDQVMPELRARFEGFHVLNRYDVGIKTNVIRLIAYQEKLGIRENKPVCMVVDYQYVFNGFDAIRTGLLGRVEDRITARMEPGWKPPAPIEPTLKPQDGLRLAEARLMAFTVPMVAFGGFTDGINPCAIATLVFFMSLLAVSGVRGRGILLMGVSFCLASFATYTALGYGILKMMREVTAFESARLVVELLMIGVLGVLAAMSFLDAYRYARTREPGAVTLQIPHRIKLVIHDVLRGGVRSQSLVMGGLTAGFLVTLLESVCTGQVYIPTLMLVARSDSELTRRAWSYLLLYNLMFILPLVAVFILTYFGLRTQTLLDYSRRHVVASKLLLGVFFLCMAILIVAL